MQQALEVLKDAEGSVVLGRVGEDVLYARLTGGLSAEVGHAFAKRLQAFASEASSLRYFSDASMLTHYDLLARSSFVRVVLADRRKFSAMTFLTWADGISPIARSYAAVLGEPIEVLTDAAEFETRLLRDAPLAKQKLDPKTWIHLSRTPTAAR